MASSFADNRLRSFDAEYIDSFIIRSRDRLSAISFIAANTAATHSLPANWRLASSSNPSTAAQSPRSAAVRMRDNASAAASSTSRRDTSSSSVSLSNADADSTGSAKPARSSATSSPSRLRPSTETRRTDSSWPTGGNAPTPHDQPAVQEDDQLKRQAILARGDEVWVYYYKDDLVAKVAARPDIFKKVK